MKIICSWCKKTIGEKEPYDDPSITHAKCTDCLNTQEKEDKRLLKRAEQQDKDIVTFPSGHQGRLSVSDRKTKLSLFEIAVNGKNFFCAETTRKALAGHLDSIPSNEVDVSFLYSMDIQLDEPIKGRRKKDLKPKKSKAIHYNCTIRVSKQGLWSMFEDTKNRMNQFAEIIADAAIEEHRKDRLAAAQPAQCPETSK